MSSLELAVIRHDVPQTVTPFSPDSQSRAIAAVSFADSLETVDDANYDYAGKIYRMLQAAEKEIEAQRTTAKRPIIDLGKLIDAAAQDWQGAIKPHRDRLGIAIATHDRKLAAQRAAYEAEQRRIREAEEAAERARLHAIAAEAQRLEDAKARELAADPVFGSMFDDLPPVRNADPYPTPAPVAIPRATVAPPPVVAKSAVKVTTRKVLRIVDADQIPRAFCDPNEARIRAALLAGDVVPGCELVEETAVGAR